MMRDAGGSCIFLVGCTYQGFFFLFPGIHVTFVSILTKVLGSIYF